MYVLLPCSSSNPCEVPAHRARSARPATLHWPSQPVSGLVLLGVAVGLGAAWRALDSDPALAAPDVGAAASWPMHAPFPHRAAYFLWHLPELLMRAHFTHWCGPADLLLRLYPHVCRAISGSRDHLLTHHHHGPLAPPPPLPLKAHVPPAAAGEHGGHRHCGALASRATPAHDARGPLLHHQHPCLPPGGRPVWWRRCAWHAV